MCARSGGVGSGSWGAVFGGGVFLPKRGGGGVLVCCWFWGVCERGEKEGDVHLRVISSGFSLPRGSRAIVPR